MPAGMRGFTVLQLCKYTCSSMDLRRATLILIAILAMADVVGVAMLWEAWSARHDKPPSHATPASRSRLATSGPAGDAPAGHVRP